MTNRMLHLLTLENELKTKGKMTLISGSLYHDHFCNATTSMTVFVPSIASKREVLSQADEQNDRASNKPRIRKESIPL